MQINWRDISKQQFIAEYWQKKPVILKNALPDFVDVIDENDLAGLAMEDDVDSRIVEKLPNQQWQLTHGPFEDFASWQADQAWSLLVQGVDNYIEEVEELKQVVNFIPKWRIDDIMISFSMAGAGVGLHLDQYDVFIIQGKGKRRWQAGQVDRTQCQTQQTSDLLQLKDPDAFVPLVDDVLEAGDVIYIPPFSAHKGETLEPAINYSIGFRAPSQQELLSSFADFIIDNDLGETRFANKSDYNNIDIDQTIPTQDIEQLQSMLQTLIEDKSLFNNFCKQYLAQNDQ